jgi:hypothetical protein
MTLIHSVTRNKRKYRLHTLSRTKSLLCIDLLNVWQNMQSVLESNKYLQDSLFEESPKRSLKIYLRLGVSFKRN